MKTEEELNQEKSLAFYSASVNAYYTTKFEYDKSLSSLSAGGVGLLFTLLTTVGVDSAASLVLYMAAMVCLLACIVSVLVIFNENAKLIVNMVSSDNVNNSKINFLDKLSKYSFGLAAIFIVLISAGVAIDSLIVKKEENKMSINIKGIRNSVDGAQLLKPNQNQQTEQKSVSGVEALKPAAKPTQSQQSQAPATKKD